MRIPLAVLLASICAPAQESTSYRDPAPPILQELEPIPAQPPTTYPELSTGTKPKPVPDGAITEDWPGFLGPRRDSKSRETGLLADWPKDGPALAWGMECGDGYASPAIQGNRLVYTHQGKGEVLIDCLHAETGKRFWRFSYPTDHVGLYPSFAGPRSTPQIDGNRVWVHGVEGMLHCLELSTGRILWKRDLMAEFKLEEQFFGVVTSPLVYGDLLIINLGVPGGPSVVAFDKTSGHLRWGTGTTWGMGCASPVLGMLHGEERLLVLTGGRTRPPTGGLMIIDPKAGSTLAEFPFRSRTYTSVNGASPVLVGSTVFLTSSYSTGSVGVELDPSGAAEQRWKVRKLGLEFSAPVAIGGKLYLIDGIRGRSGAVVCLDPETGEELNRTQIDWEEKVSVSGEERLMDFGIGAGSLLHIGADRFLCLGDSGHLLHLRCTPKGTEVLNRATLFHAIETWTPMALSRGLLYVCQNKPENIGEAPPRLLCYDLRDG